MSRLAFRLMHAAAALAAGTGIVYGWMRYALEPVDEFAVVNHPWQPFLQHLHVWTVPALVIMLGVFWQGHAWPYWRARLREGRNSGLMLFGSALPMIFSGYLIQTAASPGWRLAWIVVHVAASLLWTAGYAVHVAAHRLARRRPRAGAATRSG